MAHIPHILTSSNVTVYIDGTPHVVAAGTTQYDLVLDAIKARDVQAVRDAINVRQSVVNMSQGLIKLDGNVLTYDGYPLHGALVNRILTVVKNAGNAAPLINFLSNLMENPDRRAVDELYGFLEACDLPITADGYFLAYKKVRSDYTSIHDGKTDNSIGAKPSMPRWMVDSNKDRTCSTGLHFCSESYLPEFGCGYGNRVVIVKINPRDVVSIPSDYNNAKGRACTYEIIADVTDDVEGGFRKLAANFDTEFVKPTELEKAVSVATLPITPAPLASDEDEAPVAKAAPAPKAKGKAPKPGTSSLTDQQVREIRNMLDDGWQIASIAKAIGTSPRTVARIRDGETYTHVK